jgi:hypothetical protein
MRKNITASRASFEMFDWNTEQEQSIGWTKQESPATEPGSSKLDNVRRLAWLGVKLCSSFLHRWFNLCEFSAEAFLCALPRIHSFTGVGLEAITAPQETSSFHLGDLLGEQDLLRLGKSPDLSANQSKFDVSWRTPWLYLVFLLLVWLLLF